MKKKYIILTSILVALIVGGMTFYLTMKKPLSSGSLNDWKEASVKKRKAFVDEIMVSHFGNENVKISEQRQENYSKSIYECLDTMSSSVDEPEDKSIEDATSLCILGIMLKENFK